MLIRGQVDAIERSTDNASAYTFVASTSRTDSYGDSIDQSGWELADYRRNPVILRDHMRGRVIGRASVLGVENDRLMTTIEFARTNDAVETQQLVDGGFLRAVSVGFLPLAYEIIRDKKGNVTGYRFTKSRLLEISVVSIPANVDAMLVQGKSARSPAEIEAIRSAALSEPLDLPGLLQQAPLSLRRRQLELIRLLGGRAV